ncbi:c-type cytochrome [Isosphaeraceae bacterium EP7]
MIKRTHPSGLCLTLALACGLLAATTAHAQRPPFEIPNPDPEIERKSFQVADGFEVNLFAGDPLLAKPIQMNFDAKGRLWIASSEVYPQIQPGQTANDKVLILEDKDGDGKADTTTVFADGLLIPTGVEPGDGGAYVANSTELLYMKDTDGDGKADVRKVVLSGFGTEDTHHILHTLRWGFDGRLNMSQSIYIHSHVETPHGVRRLNGGGTWQFRPETMQLDILMKGLVNQWGHAFDRYGQSFGTDGAGGEGINYLLPGAYYVTSPEAVRIVRGLNPGSPKHAGLEIVSGRHLPDDWQGNFITNDFRGNRVCRFVVTEDGAGFASRELGELIKTSHMAFRPIDVKMGPDGAIYIADWYNPIIQHGEVDFRDPRRDHTRGRIWRVTAKNRPTVERPKLEDAPVTALLDKLKSPEDATRHFARRVLKERGATEVIPALAAWTAALAPDAQELRLEALWTYQSLDVVEPALLSAMLDAKDGRIRAAAVRVTRNWADRVSDPLALLAPRVLDEHPRARLEAVRALAHIPDSRSAGLALKALDKPQDRYLDYALWLTARELAPQWLPQAQSKEGREAAFSNPSHLVFALISLGNKDSVAPLMAMIAEGLVPADREDAVMDLIATQGGPAELTKVFEMAVVDGPTADARRASLLQGLMKATRQNKGQPTGDLGRLANLAKADRDPALRATATRAAGLWKVEPILAALREQAGKNVDVSLAPALVEALASAGDVPTLAKLAGSGDVLSNRSLAVAALAGLDATQAAKLASGLMAGDSAAPAVPVLIGAFLNRKGGADVLAGALKETTLPGDVARVAVRLARGSGAENPGLVKALTVAGKLDAAREPLAGPELTAFLTDVAAKGDAARGEALFRRAELNCIKCHAVAGAGGQVGPGLESIGASAQPDYLVDSLLQPAKAVKENYHATVVGTVDGQVKTGIKVRQTDSELILRDAEDAEIAIPLSSIEDQKPGGSLMPAGLTDSLTRDELLDLVKFLSSLGKVGPYSVGKARLARRWRVLEPNAATETLLRRNRLDIAASADPALRFLPVYSMVSGVLPLADLAPINLTMKLAGQDYGSKFGFARCEIDVSTAGAVKLGLEDISGLMLWVDGRVVEPKPELTLDLPAGVRTLTIGVDLQKRLTPVRVELEEVAASPARAQFVLGK